MNEQVKVVTIVGARPQFIKAAAVSRAIARHNASHPDRTLVEKIVHTGQHYDDNMSQVFFDELDIPRPDINLGIGSGSHGAQTGRMLERIEAILAEERPDWCLVYGDTNSTMAGALAAVKLHVPVAHVEAGLRSFNRRMPEEINRIVTDHVAKALFVPTRTAVENLRAEGIFEGVELVGDVMYDCILYYGEKVRPTEQDVLARHGLARQSYALATIHRAENTDEATRLGAILDALEAIARQGCPVFLPLHPRTRRCAEDLGLAIPAALRVVPPVSYLEMIALEKNARLILTDSGGVQKEACWLRVPCVTLRQETEWLETVESGWNTLAGTERDAIVHAARHASDKRPEHGTPVYADGSAGERICRILCDYVQKPAVARPALS